jgi:hypothetical protein
VMARCRSTTALSSGASTTPRRVVSA